MYTKGTGNMDNTIEIQQFLDSRLHKIIEDRYFLECYSECLYTPAWFIKTEPTDLEKREQAIQHYLKLLVEIFSDCPKPTVPTVAMYIPSHDEHIFSNCGKVVSMLAGQIDWLIDGTKHIKRTRTIAAKHTQTEQTEEEHTQANSLSVQMDLSDKNIILFDDRMTSGNSVNQVARFLQAKGARHVWFVAFDLTDRRVFFIKNNYGEFCIKLTLGCQWFEFGLRLMHSMNGAAFYFGTDGTSNVRVFVGSKMVYATLNGKEYRSKIKQQQNNMNVWVGKIYDNEQEMK